MRLDPSPPMCGWAAKRRSEGQPRPCDREPCTASLSFSKIAKWITTACTKIDDSKAR
jgi:hypothetical protein